MLFPAYRPREPTRSWVLAKGSTRSYAMLADRTSVTTPRGGIDKVRAWIRIFASMNQRSIAMLRVELLNQSNRKTISKLMASAHQN